MDAELRDEEFKERHRRNTDRTTHTNTHAHTHTEREREREKGGGRGGQSMCTHAWDCACFQMPKERMRGALKSLASVSFRERPGFCSVFVS